MKRGFIIYSFHRFSFSCFYIVYTFSVYTLQDYGKQRHKLRLFLLLYKTSKLGRKYHFKWDWRPVEEELEGKLSFLSIEPVALFCRVMEGTEHGESLRIKNIGDLPWLLS